MASPSRISGSTARHNPVDKEHLLLHEPTGTRVATVRILEGWWAKGVGVIGMPNISPATGFVFPAVASVHTMFVSFPLDILFLDKTMRLLMAIPGVRPWRPLIRCAGAYYTVELAAGSLADRRLLEVGCRWKLEAQLP